MSEETKITVFKRKGRKFYEAQWVDPVTELKQTRSTRCRKKRDADRAAGKIAEQLEAGTLKTNHRITWEDFRQRYEAEKLATQSENARLKNYTTFNLIERLINPKQLNALDEAQISRFQSTLRGMNRTEATLHGHLANLKAALRWARKMKLLRDVPEIDMPKAGKSGGRPITTEEFERKLVAVERVLYPRANSTNTEVVDSWKHLLIGLWWSGLRLGEALKLHWKDDKELCVDFDGKLPMFRINSQTDKARKERIITMAPEFSEFLKQTPEDAREGFVFNPQQRRSVGMRMRLDSVSSLISKMGKASGIKVSEKTNGKLKFASAHDLRRAFGFRWSTRVMPPTLMEMMRHEKIETTMTYYVGRNAQAAAQEAWNAVANTSTNTFDFGSILNEENPSKQGAF